MSGAPLLKLINDCEAIGTTDADGRPRRQSDVLIDIGQRHVLFHDKAGTAYAQVRIGDHDEVYAIDSVAYREILAASFFNAAGRGCNRNAVTDAITTLSSMSKFRGETHDVSVRVAAGNDRIFIDTGRSDWRCIEVDSNGWHYTRKPPRFRRAGAPQPLPEPAAPDFSRLWRYVNVRDEHKPLVAGFILASLSPTGPYPQLHLSGEQGTGKSTAARIIRAFIDPSASALRAPPKEVRDLLVGALNGWCLSLDNLSFLTPQLSDALCRLATGGAISERQLYTNTDEVLVEVQRPVILNGIEDLATRPDLAERGLHVELEPISNRRPERAFWAAFKVDAPHIFGALLKALSRAIRDHRQIKVGKLPRMADFALWVAAGIPALGFTVDEFMTAYRENIGDAMSSGIDSSPIGRPLLAYMQGRTTWTGTAADLLKAVVSEVGEPTVRSHAWPKTPRAMSGCLDRLAPALRLAGVDYRRERRSAGARYIRLCNQGKQPSQASQPSLAAHTDNGHDGDDDQNCLLHDEVIEP